jgi:hypothetical protein
MGAREVSDPLHIGIDHHCRQIILFDVWPSVDLYVPEAMEGEFRGPAGHVPADLDRVCSLALA